MHSKIIVYTGILLFFFLTLLLALYMESHDSFTEVNVQQTISKVEETAAQQQASALNAAQAHEEYTKIAERAEAMIIYTYGEANNLIVRVIPEQPDMYRLTFFDAQGAYHDIITSIPSDS